MPKPVIPIKPPYTPELLPIVQYAIESWLPESASVFEFGSGHSTLWFAGLCGSVVSVEHEPEWYEAVVKELESARLEAAVHLVEWSDIAHEIDGYEQFDLVLVDCLDGQRVRAVMAAMKHVRPGGYLVIDDSHWEMLKPAHYLLARWGRVTVSGRHTRKDGFTAPHETTFYQEALANG